MADRASADAKGGPGRGGAGPGGCCRERRSRGDPGGFRLAGPGAFPQRRRDRTPKVQKLIFIGKTQNKQPLPPTFKLGGGELRICTFLPYVHSRIRLEKVPPPVGAEAALQAGAWEPSPFSSPDSVFSFVKWAQGKPVLRSFSPALKMSQSEG